MGIAISTYTGEPLRALGVREITDVALITPGVYTGDALAGQDSQVTIRGVVQYIIRKPTYEQLEGFADLEWGMYDNSSGSHDAQSYRLAAAIGAPITDRFAARIAATCSERDPYLTNLYPLDAFGMGSAGAPGFGDDPGPGSGADMGDEEAKAARGTLMWKITDDVEMMLSASWGKTNVGTGPYQSAATQPVFNDLGEHVNSVPAPVNLAGNYATSDTDTLTQEFRPMRPIEPSRSDDHEPPGRDVFRLLFTAQSARSGVRRKYCTASNCEDIPLHSNERPRHAQIGGAYP